MTAHDDEWMQSYDPANGAPPDSVRDWDDRHYLHPWDMPSPTPDKRTIAARGEGVHVIDPDGNRYLDGPGGMWCVQIGYGRAEMAEAIADQVLRLPYYSPWNFASEPSSLLARRLALLAPGDLNRVFFATGGSSAVDSAIRLRPLLQQPARAPGQEDRDFARVQLPRPRPTSPRRLRARSARSRISTSSSG